MTKMNYRGLVINPRPYQLADTGRWVVNVVIEHHRGHAVDEKPFNASNTFETKDEAVEHCVRFGQQIVDGRYPELSLP